ncbi:hypothetical protein MCEMSEM23_01974 [Rhabdaerophilaceae bacterium]
MCSKATRCRAVPLAWIALCLPLAVEAQQLPPPAVRSLPPTEQLPPPAGGTLAPGARPRVGGPETATPLHLRSPRPATPAIGNPEQLPPPGEQAQPQQPSAPAGAYGALPAPTPGTPGIARPAGSDPATWPPSSRPPQQGGVNPPPGPGELAVPRPSPQAAPAAAAANGLPAVPANQVLVAIENVSPGPLDVFVDPPNGGDPIFVMSINSGFIALQPTPPGRTWRFAQNDQWLGGFRPTAEARQRVTFNGRAP